MSLFNKVIWSEGMFLRPQHFQQQDRYLEHLVRSSATGLTPHTWGFQELELDSDLLKTGKLALRRCAGIMPDGTPFQLPELAEVPAPLELDETIQDSIVYLALPVRDARGAEAGPAAGLNGAARYSVQDSEVVDSSGLSDAPAEIQLGRLAFRLMLEGEERSGHHCLGIARIAQVGADKGVVFDDSYIPTCLDCQAADQLSRFLNELEGLLRQRGEGLAGHVSDAGRGGAAEIADFMLLEAVNRVEPLVAHFAQLRGLHPESLFRLLVSTAGELATFATAERRPPAFPAYRHDALKETFEPVMASLRQSLSMVFERAAIAIPLVEKKYGIRVATIGDKKLLDEAHFVLAVNAEVPVETLRRNFPAQVKIGPVEKIRDLVNRALPGIALDSLASAPRQIPYHAGVTYFALNDKEALWKELSRSGGLALHVSGQYPGLELALWAIRR